MHIKVRLLIAILLQCSLNKKDIKVCAQLMVCVDTDVLCPFWSSIGECSNNQEWMQINCPLSCGFCLQSRRPFGGRPPLTPSPPSNVITSDAFQDFDQFPPLQGGFALEILPRGVPAALKLPNGEQQQQFPDYLSEELLPPIQPTQLAASPARPQPPPSRPKQRRPPTVAQNNVFQRCLQIRDQHLNESVDLLLSEHIIFAIEDAINRETLSADRIKQENEGVGCVPDLLAPSDCVDNLCYHLMYRSMDGTCNNLKNPIFGAAFTTHLRHLPPLYDDNFGAPVSSINNRRPNPRDISQFLLRSGQTVVDNKYNTLLMQWGQFVSHDLVKTTLAPNKLCLEAMCFDDINGRCLPIAVNRLDQQSQQFCEASGCCIKNTRATPICGTGQRSPRLQLNENTAFIDASQIYGSSIQDAAKFRASGNPAGFMKVSMFDNHAFMPFDRDRCPGQSDEPCRADFQAGDDRANVFLGLASMHTLFLRWHNTLANQLNQLNRHWDGERLYQETRKIVGAVLQAITYQEYLPKIFGDAAFNKEIGIYASNNYDPDINPSIAAEFSGAAFRFGHGMINNFVERVTNNGNQMNTLRFADTLESSGRMLMEGGLDPIIRGLLLTPLKRPQRFSMEPTDHLFGRQDLAAINIERGRDLGLAGYNEWRKFCGLKVAEKFSDFSNEFSADVINQLQRMYGNPNEIDLYVGALMENPLPDGLIGPTLVCILGDQFRRIRDGDRFWYQRSGVFTASQLSAIEKISLSRVVCEAGDQFQFVPADAFLLAPLNQFVHCDSLPFLNLDAWKV